MQTLDTITASDEKIQRVWDNIIDWQDKKIAGFEGFRSGLAEEKYFDSFRMENLVKGQAEWRLAGTIKTITSMYDPEGDDDRRKRIQYIMDLCGETLRRNIFSSTSLMQNAIDLAELRVAQDFLDRLVWW